MPSLCSECGPVTPQELPGMAHLSCPNCGRAVMHAGPPHPSPQAAPYGAYAGNQPPPYGTAPGGYAAEWPAQAGYAPPGYAPAQGYGDPYAQAQNPYAAMPEFYAQRYDIGMVARRWLSTVVDHVILLVFVMATLVLAELLLGEELYATVLPVTVSAVLVAALAYFPWLEGKYGATPGKRLAGVRVVDQEGNAPGLAKGCIRTALRLVEVNPVFLGGLIAAVCVLVTRNHQRLGDLAAGTHVLLKEDADAVLRARGAPQW